MSKRGRTNNNPAPKPRGTGTKPKNAPPKKKRNLLQRILHKLKLYYAKAYKYMTTGGNGSKTILIGAGCALLVLIISLSVYNMVKKNAYSITVGETQVAFIKMGKEDITDELEKQAVLKIENLLGTRIMVNEKVAYTPVHASKKEMVSSDEAILKIADNFTYKIEAFEITVEGTQMAILKNQKEVDTVFDAIIEPYLVDGVKIVEHGFVEDVQSNPLFVEEDELDDVDKALRVLTSTLETAETYTIAPGDSLGTIASKSGMTLEGLLAVNPNMTVNTVLHIGDVLNLTIDKPLISVRTVEERSFTDVEPVPIQHQQNPNERTTYKRTIQYGSVGQAEVTQHVIRINGMESETVEYARNITLPPTPEIIEIGTKP